MYENNNNGSFIKMPSEKVSELCNKTLNGIKEYRAKEKVKYVIEAKELFANSWWNKFRKIKMPTDNEILHGDRYPLSSASDCIDRLYWATEQTVKGLLKACEYADEVYVSVAELKYLWSK